MTAYPKKFLDELEQAEQRAAMEGKTLSAGFKKVIEMAREGHPDLIKAMVANIESEPIDPLELVMRPGNIGLIAKNKLSAYMRVIRLIRYQIEEEEYVFKP